MVKYVNTVLVGKAAPAALSATVAAMAEGEVALFNENKKLITAAADVANAKGIFIGMKTGKQEEYITEDGTAGTVYEIIYSQMIQRGKGKAITVNNFVAPVQDKATIDLTGATIVIGQSYTIRIAYRDIYEHPGIFTHTYTATASTAVAADLAAAFAKQINRSKNRRVNVAVAGAVINLTAREITRDDNVDVKQVWEYSRIIMQVGFNTALNTGINSAVYTPVPGAIVTNVSGNDGQGFWKVVRDQERNALSNKGFAYFKSYFSPIASIYTVKGEEYDSIVVQWNNDFRSADNQYIKDTPLSCQIFVPAGLAEPSAIAAGIADFIGTDVEIGTISADENTAGTVAEPGDLLNGIHLPEAATAP